MFPDYSVDVFDVYSGIMGDIPAARYRERVMGESHEANINWSMVICQGSTRSNYLEVYWPCAGGLSAVNAIGTQLRDPINSGLTRWRMAVS